MYVLVETVVRRLGSVSMQTQWVRLCEETFRNWFRRTFRRVSLYTMSHKVWQNPCSAKLSSIPFSSFPHSKGAIMLCGKMGVTVFYFVHVNDVIVNKSLSNYILPAWTNLKKINCIFFIITSLKTGSAYMPLILWW